MTKKIIYKPLNLNLKIPAVWHEQLNNLAEDKGKSLNELFISIIGQTLESETNQKLLNADNHDDKEAKDTTDNEYKQLNDRLNTLEAKQNQSAELEKRLVILEKLMDLVQHQINARDYAGKLPVHSLAPAVDDDYYDDEPDEILTDFLD